MPISNNFSYLDQFRDVHIDLSPYIDSINTFTNVPYTFTNKQPVKTTLRNIFTKTNITLEFKNKYSAFEPYLLVQYDTIEAVAFDYYNTTDYWWIIALFNNIKNTYTDWLLMDVEISLIADFYFKHETKYTRDVYYNLINELNDKRRQLLLLRPEYATELVLKFRNEVGQ